jgi:hypothetical protein
MRVSDLAKNLGIESADLMAILEDLGIAVVSDASQLQPVQAAAVLDHPDLPAARARKLQPKAPPPTIKAEPVPAQPPVRQVIITPPPKRSDEAGITSTETAPASEHERPSARTPEHPNAPEPEPVKVEEPPPPPKPIDPIEAEWAEAMSTARKPILLWGPPGSGKSTFLAGMMFRQAEEDDLDPFDWRVMSVGPRAGDYVRSVLQAYKAGGQPNATIVTDAPFRFKIRKYRKQRRVLGVVPRGEQILLEADLVFVDPPGELFTVSKMRGRAGQRLLELMENAAGVLLLIDPTFSEPEATEAAAEASDADRELRRQSKRQNRYWTMLVENISEVVDHFKQQPARVRSAALDEENRLRIPTAICITKMDQHTDEAHRPAEFLRAQLGDAAFSVIENSFSNYSVYACSALGNDLQVTEEGVRLNGNPKPWGVIDPIRWILEESVNGPRNQVLARFGW